MSEKSLLVCKYFQYKLKKKRIYKFLCTYIFVFEKFRVV